MRRLYAKSPTPDQRQELEAGLRCADGFTVRRSQIILMSADERLPAGQIGERIGQSDQQVRRVLHAFNANGTECLHRQPRRQDYSQQRAFDEVGEDKLRKLVEESPRDHGFETSIWTLDLLAEASFQQGLTEQRVHLDTVRVTLERMGINWQRAKHRIASPDPNYDVKKNDGTG